MKMFLFSGISVLKCLFHRNVEQCRFPVFILQDSADLSGTGVSNDLFVSRAVHKACVYINESGTEAVAATAVVERERNRPNQFTVDRPFLFVITDTLCQSLQFVGRGVNPEEIQGQRWTREGEREIRPRYSNRT